MPEPSTPPVKRRFVGKPLGKKFGVYDTVMGSWPKQRAISGEVAQDLPTLAEADTEADRLNTIYGGRP